MKIENTKHVEGEYSWYEFIMGRTMRASYCVNYIRNTTQIIVYDYGYSQWNGEGTYHQEEFTFPAAIPLNEEDPHKTIERIRKLISLK